MSLIEIDESRWVESTEVSVVAINRSSVTITLRCGKDVHYQGRGAQSMRENAVEIVDRINNANCNNERG